MKYTTFIALLGYASAQNVFDTKEATPVEVEVATIDPAPINEVVTETTTEANVDEEASKPD